MPFAILGPRELCTGDPARRMGNEYLFQTLAEQNVETLDEAGVTKIVANCPHCFNTLRNEYPDYGGSYEVIHHTQLLARLIGRDDCRRPRRSTSCSRTTTLLPRPPQRRVRARPGTSSIASRACGRWRCRGTPSGVCAAGRGGPDVDGGAVGKRINVERTDEAAATGADTWAWPARTA